MFGVHTSRDQRGKLLRIPLYIVSAYVPMSLQIHLNPCSPEDPSNMLFLRDLWIDFSDYDVVLVEQSFIKVFTKHIFTWMNPTNLFINVHSKNPAFQLKNLRDVQQHLQDEVNTVQLTWKRVPLKS